MQCKGMAAAAALVAGLAGCGGGGTVGVGLGLGFGDDRTLIDPDVERVLLAVGLFDALAGTERMLAASDGLRVIEGPVGVDRRAACAGGGSIRVHKVDAVTADLAPTECRLRADDGLVYSGAWRFTLTATSFPATGACPAAATCELRARIDTTNAVYGYGRAFDAVLGNRLRSISTAGVRTAQVTATVGEEVVPSVDGTVLSGSLDQLVVRLPGAVDWRISGDVQRQVLRVDSPFRATLTLGPAITAALDDNQDGVVDRTLTIPWRAFLD